MVAVPHFKCSIARWKQRCLYFSLVSPTFIHSLQGNILCVGMYVHSFSENFLQLKREYHHFKIRIFKKSIRFLKNLCLCFYGVSNLFILFFLFLLLVGHVRRRFVSSEISFKRKYCRCLRKLPYKGNLINILT